MLFGLIRVSLPEHGRFGWFRGHVFHGDVFRGHAFSDSAALVFQHGPHKSGRELHGERGLAPHDSEFEGTAAGPFVAAAVKERDPIRDRLAVIAREHVIGAEAEP